MTAEEEPLRVGDQVTARTSPVIDPAELCGHPHAVVAEVVETIGATYYRLAYPDGRPVIARPIAEWRLRRGWQ